MSTIKQAQNNHVKKAILDPNPIGTALKTISEKHPEVLELQKEFEEIEDREFLQKEGNTTLIITGNGIIKSFKVDLSQAHFPVQFKDPAELHQWIDRIVTIINMGTTKAAQKRTSLRKRIDSVFASMAKEQP